MKPGIHTIPADQYHADDLDERATLSSHLAYLICARSPLHAWAASPRLNPDHVAVEDEKFDIGSAAHALLLEGEDRIAVIEADSWRTNAAKEARDVARAAGRYPLLEKDAATVRAMVAATWDQLAALDVDPPLFVHGLPEQTLIWEDEGVLCRARLDWLHSDAPAIDDLKTTRGSANPEVWARRMFDLGADIQAAFYIRAIEVLTGKLATFRFCVVEQQPPYALSVVAPGLDALALAERKVQHALKTWRECLEANRWPGYPAQVAYLNLPAYEEAQWLEREGREVA